MARKIFNNKAKAETEDESKVESGKKAADSRAEETKVETKAVESQNEPSQETKPNTNDIRSMQDWGVAKANADLAIGAAMRFNLDFDNDMVNEKEYDELIDKFGKGSANVK